MQFVELLTFRGIRWKRHSTPGEIWIQCPFCNDALLRYGLNLKKNVGHCFRCDVSHGRAMQAFLRQLDAAHVTLSDAVEERSEEEAAKKIELPEGFFLLADVRKSDGEFDYAPRRYLLKRGITKEQIRKHYIGATYAGRFKYRIIIPVHYNRKLLGIVARDFTGQLEPKYLNSSGEKSVYNLAKREGEKQELVLSEGCFKALAIERALPFFRSSALLGHAVTDLQIEQMIEAGFRNATLFSDPDKAGMRGTLKVAAKLADERFDVRICYPIPHAQADEMTEEEIRNYVINAKPFDRMLARRLQQEAA